MKYRNILESIDEGYYEVDLKGNFTFTNRAVAEIFGYTSSELLGMNHRDYTSKPTANRLFNIFRGVFETKRPSRILDYDVTRKDGDLRILEMSPSLIENESGEPAGFRGIARDVTERRLAEQEREKLEKELQQAEKMKAIGTLAGGVAHDLNNILSGIVSYPEQKAIIASGFSETDRVKKAQHFGVGEYLPKPYTIEKIGQAVKSELKNSQKQLEL